MKFRCMLVLLLLQSMIVLSQEKLSPQIKKGSTLTFQVSANGQLFPIQMKVDSIGPDYSRFGWSMQDGSGGFVTNTKSSMEAANKGYWGQLNNGEDMTMPADQSIIIFSKSIWNAAQKDKKFTFDSQDFIVKEQPIEIIFKLGDRIVNVMYAETSNASSKVWFLNNAAAPIIVKMEGNPLGIDYFLQSIE